MTETSADWVERPKPASVAARTKRPPINPKGRSRERAGQQPSTPAPVDPRLVAGGAATVALLAALLLWKGRTRR
jgi:hypothetical protein